MTAMYLSVVSYGLSWADRLTISRLCCAPLLLIAATGGARMPFVALTFYGMLSDIVDGAVARSTASASPRGARLDSRADLAFYPAVLLGLMLMFPAQFRAESGTLALVLTAYAMPILLGWFKFGTLTAYHTVLARLALGALPITAMLWLATGATPPLYGAVTLFVLSAVEEMLITLRLRTAQSNIPHVFALPHDNPPPHRAQ
jgi:cardiolipin synthase (CMP-forming)